MRDYLRRACFAAATVVAILSLAPATVAQAPAKVVLIVHGGPEQFPGNATFDDTLRQRLFSHPTMQVDAYTEYLENEEFGDAAYTSLYENIRLKFITRRIDLVIANTAPALQFVLRYRDDLFPGVPVIFATAAVPSSVTQHTVEDVTGILREPSQTETIDLALKLHPATKRLHVIAYAPAVDGFEERVQATLAPFSKRVTVTYSEEPTLPEMLADLKKLPPDTVIFYVRYSPITKGRVIYPDEMLPEIAADAPAPIYSSLETNLGKGVVGGMMRSGPADANRLGDMALAILEGGTTKQFPIESAAISPMFDARELQHWHINPSLLPANTDIRYRTPSVWELYGSYIIVTVVVVVAQLVLILELLRQRARLSRADNIIRSREASLRTSYDRIRNMAGRLINAQETARADIARDLHDDVSQKLAYVSIGVNSLRTATGDIQGAQTQQMFDELERETRNTFEGIRRLSHDLHPATLRLLGLAPALRSHCNEVAKRQGVEVQFSSGESLDTVHPDVAVCLFRIAQESLRNGITHGGATHLRVTLQRSGDQLELTVSDDGSGFDVNAARSDEGGLGLITMEERVNLIGGTVTIESAVGRGTTVCVRGPANPA